MIPTRMLQKGLQANRMIIGEESRTHDKGYLHRESNMSAPVLFNLLNKLRKRDKM